MDLKEERFSNTAFEHIPNILPTMFLQIYLSTEGKETQRDKQQQLSIYFNSSVKFERIDGNEEFHI